MLKRDPSVSSMTTLSQRMAKNNSGIRTHFMRTSASSKNMTRNNSSYLSGIESHRSLGLSDNNSMASLLRHSNSQVGSSGGGGGSVTSGDASSDQGGRFDSQARDVTEAHIYENPNYDSSSEEEELLGAKEAMKNRKLAYISTGVVGLSRHHRYRALAPAHESAHASPKTRRRLRKEGLVKEGSRASVSYASRESSISNLLSPNARRGHFHSEEAADVTGFGRSDKTHEVALFHAYPNDMVALEKAEEKERRRHPKPVKGLSPRRIKMEEIPVSKRTCPKPLGSMQGPKVHSRLDKKTQNEIGSRLTRRPKHKGRPAPVGIAADKARAKKAGSRRRRRRDPGEITVDDDSDDIEIFYPRQPAYKGTDGSDVPQHMKDYILGRLGKPPVQKAVVSASKLDGPMRQYLLGEMDSDTQDDDDVARADSSVLISPRKPRKSSAQSTDINSVTHSNSDDNVSMESADLPEDPLSLVGSPAKGSTLYLDLPSPRRVNRQRSTPMTADHKSIKRRTFSFSGEYPDSEPGPPPGSPMGATLTLPDTEMEPPPAATPQVVRNVRPRNRAGTDLLGVAQTLALFKVLHKTQSTPIVESGAMSDDGSQEVRSRTGRGWSKLRKQLKSHKYKSMREDVIEFDSLRKDKFGKSLKLLRDEDKKAYEGIKSDYNPSYILGDVAAASQAIKDADRRKNVKDSKPATEKPVALMSSRYQAIHKSDTLDGDTIAAAAAATPASPATMRKNVKVKLARARERSKKDLSTLSILVNDADEDRSHSDIGSEVNPDV